MRKTGKHGQNKPDHIWRARKKVRAAITACSAALILSAALAGCGDDRGETADYLRVGYVKYSPDDAYINKLTDCFRAAMENMQSENLLISVSVKDAAGSQRTENQVVEELIDGGSDVLCVNLVDRTAPSDIIEMAKDRDIPVIFINREPVREDLMLWEKLYYVGSDASESGVLQGELAAEWIDDHPTTDRNRDGKIQYVLLEGEPDHQDAIIRTEKCVSTLVEEGIVPEKLSYQIANWNRAQAESRMTQMIAQYGNSIELVLANNDEMALGTVDAYDKANITESERPAVFGIDGTRDGLEAVLDGRLAGTVYHDAEGEAAAIADLAFALYDQSGNAGDGRPSEDSASGSYPSLEDLPLVDRTYIYLSYSKVGSAEAQAYLER